MSAPPDEPAFRVVNGSPTTEELAIIVAVLRTRAATPPTTAPPSRWRMSARPASGALPRPASGAWRSAARPA